MSRRAGTTPVDPRDLPNYGIVETAWSVGLSPSTVRAWAFGDGRSEPLFRPAAPDALSYWNLAELYVLRSLRVGQGVSMHQVRRALVSLAKIPNRGRPLIEFEFLTDGIDVFIEESARLIAANRGNQFAVRQVLIKSLKRIQRDWFGLPDGIAPWHETPDDPIAVEISPSRAFGRLVVVGTRIPAECLISRHRAGDSVERLAYDYCLEPAKIKAALAWGPRVAKTA